MPENQNFKPNFVAKREAHIAETHLDFYHWFDDVKQGKYVTVVIVSETSPAERNWIITAYITRRVMNGEIEWQKS